MGHAEFKSRRFEGASSLFGLRNKFFISLFSLKRGEPDPFTSRREI